MHKEVRQFIKAVRKRHPTYFFFSDVAEFGSLNVNGSAREYFWFCDYTGIDIGYGRGVDVVSKAHEFKNGYWYDAVVSTEMLEHDCHWKDSLRNMYDSLREGGIMIFTCAAPNRAEHGTKRTSPQDSPYTNEYYRNISIEDFESVLPAGLFEEGACLYYERDEKDLFFVGIKKMYLPFKNYV